MNELEFNADNTQIGFRLDYMELLNWGTFNNRIWQIAPKGNNSLLTGAIGSGKSTVVDALTCLLVPHQKITFNKAAGAEGKERTFRSYIRGEYRNTKSEFGDAAEKRKGKAIGLRYNNENDTTFSVILANFSNLGYSSDITLAQVFWIENETVSKLLVVSTKALKIKETFEHIEDGKSLKQRIKSLPNIEYVGDNFSEYSQKFRHLFGMTSGKAVDLFNQTVSMKSVNSLTLFVREQMLEQSDIKIKIEDLKKRFTDLSKAHDAVKEVREQRDILLPLENFNAEYNSYKLEMEEIDNIVSSINSYFAVRKITLLEIEIKSREEELNRLNNQLEQIKDDLNSKNKAINQIESDIDDNGGTRLTKIQKEIEDREKTKTAKKERYIKYSGLTSFCGLTAANTERTFYSNRKLAEDKINEIKTANDRKLKEYGAKTAECSNLEKIITTAEAELHSLQNRQNQIPMALLDIRAQIADDLRIDENEILFVGELIKVKDEEKKWEGALERLLRGFGISLLVPEKHYHAVSGYINAKVLSDKNKRGMKLDYFSVPQNTKVKNQNIEIDADSVVNKIEIKDNQYFKDWLQADLERHFNLRCVLLEEFQTMRQDAITLEGQYKKGKKYTKDDRRELWDRTKFVLGWSNVEKIKALAQQLTELNAAKDRTIEDLRKQEIEMAGNSALDKKLSSLKEYVNWNELNWQDEVKKIEELKQEEIEIKASNDVLKSLFDKLAKVKEETENLLKEQSVKSEKTGALKDKIKDYREEIIKCDSEANSYEQQKKEVFYPKIDKLIKDINLTFKNADKTREDLKNKYVEKNGEKDKLNRKLLETSSGITAVMQNYKLKFPADTLELSAEIGALPEFLGKYKKIVSEGLPEHESRFREMLKKNTIEDIRVFDVSLDTDGKQIKQKIDEINKHLKEIEFNNGTYIKLLTENNSDKEIVEFKKDLRDCYTDIFDLTDAYTEKRFGMVKKFLDRFMSNESKDVDWAKKVTDVRNWFLFGASERNIEDDTDIEYYSDSAGKSGGQKEKLAYTILASALAYQFGLLHGEPRSKSFRFAVIDEAFGRGDDESTQFGLELFKKLHLQLLVVTPLQKIHIIENYINSVHIVSNSQGNNSEIQYLTIEEYKQEKRQRSLINIIEETIQ